MKQALTRLGFFILWLFHWLPLGVQAMIGNAVGWLAFALARRRKRIARRNLELCFPEKSAAEIRRLLRLNLQASVRVALEHGLLIWASAKRLKRLIHVENMEYLDVCQKEKEPVILLVPHFVGIGMGGIRLSIDYQLANIYRQVKNPIVDQQLLKSRTRFKHAGLISRHEGIRPLIRLVKAHIPLHYSPDLDYGRLDSIFVPFFGISAATVPALARLAKLTGARIVPATTRQLPSGQGYVLKFYPAWENYPSGDLEADTRRMNRFIEDRIREMPEQYLWTHRRFKTRPPGEPGLYD